MLELTVKVININLPAGHTILKQCRPLYEYSWFIQKVKKHLQEDLLRSTTDREFQEELLRKYHISV